MPKLTRERIREAKRVAVAIEVLNGEFDLKLEAMWRDFGASRYDPPSWYPSDAVFDRAEEELRTLLTRWVEAWVSARRPKRYLEDRLDLVEELGRYSGLSRNIFRKVVRPLKPLEAIPDPVTEVDVPSQISYRGVDDFIDKLRADAKTRQREDIRNFIRILRYSLFEGERSFTGTNDLIDVAGLAECAREDFSDGVVPLRFVDSERALREGVGHEAVRLFLLLLYTTIPVRRCKISTCRLWFHDPSNSPKRFCDECQQRERHRQIARWTQERRDEARPITIELAKRAIAEFERQPRSGDWKEFVVERINPELRQRKIKPISKNFLTRRIKDGTLIEPKLNPKGGR